MKRLHETQDFELNNQKTIGVSNIAAIFQGRRLVYGSGVLFLVLMFAGFTTGHANYVFNAYPPMNLGENITTLECNYADNEITLDVATYDSVYRYYHYNSTKSSSLDNAHFNRLAESHPNDTFIAELADDIRDLGYQYGLNDDQLVELTTCFIQNIPYDEQKAEVVLSDAFITDRELAQYPYETIYNNSGICTGKTYLGSALLQELGYGTGIMLFPDAQHMALGIKSPDGYTDFGTSYAYMEMTAPGFAPGEIPSSVNESNGTPAVSISSINDLDISDDPSDYEYTPSGTISMPNMIVDVNEGQEYRRIVIIRNLEQEIINRFDGLESSTATLNQQYDKLMRLDANQASAYNTYLATPSTTLDCGYSYDYSYNSYYYDSYYSPSYRYSCDTVNNPRKSQTYNNYLYALDSYNAQVDYYNQLISEHNRLVDAVEIKIDQYKSFDYHEA
ncbi:MAG: hypothetical protein U5K77_03590 [Candidatus Saccharibacteria bacterium]|nr:hypothetical protein [Candidatus Saccharibacteria bacterium]